MSSSDEEDHAAPIPGELKSDIKEFVRIDDGLKSARLEMKEAR